MVHLKLIFVYFDEVFWLVANDWWFLSGNGGHSLCSLLVFDSDCQSSKCIVCSLSFAVTTRSCSFIRHRPLVRLAWLWRLDRTVKHACLTLLSKLAPPLVLELSTTWPIILRQFLSVRTHSLKFLVHTVNTFMLFRKSIDLWYHLLWRKKCRRFTSLYHFHGWTWTLFSNNCYIHWAGFACCKFTQDVYLHLSCDLILN